MSIYQPAAVWSPVDVHLGHAIEDIQAIETTRFYRLALLCELIEMCFTYFIYHILSTNLLSYLSQSYLEKSGLLPYRYTVNTFLLFYRPCPVSYGAYRWLKSNITKYMISVLYIYLHVLYINTYIQIDIQRFHNFIQEVKLSYILYTTRDFQAFLVLILMIT